LNIEIQSQGFHGDNGSVTIGGFLPIEQEKFLGMVLGYNWVKVDEGRLKVVPATEKLPAPAENKDLMPHWLSKNQKEGRLKRKIFCAKGEWPPFSPSFIIKHLCGYNWTPEAYKLTAEQLEGFGFECMRSRRGNDGKFWEIWYLPGLWAAKGNFQKFFSRSKKMDEKAQIEKAINFLCQNVSFGSLDVVAQRAAMTLD
jgi:hypothetical protein